ncbi:hypothetical protein O181_038009 [Austropuccinia psidii MF-1]|uniref:Uncharacterized protein n=1 Tax=Austropuccinia psidii MF-1 TaxID=1389203 RepID=A0A9Q3HD61_9BASI|nr:hypothetical protein [Austropuccinia psidii MF-1]
MPKQTLVLSSIKDIYKEEIVENQLFKAQANPTLSSKIGKALIYVLYTSESSISSDNGPLGAIRGHQVDITLNIYRPYPPILSRPAHPASRRAREFLKTNLRVDKAWISKTHRP